MPYKNPEQHPRPEYHRAYHRDIRWPKQIMTKYGIAVEEYRKRLEEQDGVCAVCHKPEMTNRRLSIDHNHETGQIRGLLCQKCNLGLGYFKSSPALLRSAIDYLSKSLS